MALTSLTGRRGWTTVASLTAVLGGLLAVQLPTASATDLAATPVTAGPAAPEPDGLRLGWRAGARTAAVVRAAAPSPAAVAPDAAAGGAAGAGPAAATGSRTAPASASATGRVAPVRVAPARPAARPAAPPAPAASLCSGAGWQQRRGQAALASLKGGAGKAGYRISFQPARSGVLGLTYLDEKRIALFVRSCSAESTGLLRHVMAHELGHAHDTELMSAASRRAWMDLRGIPAGTPWYGCDGCTDFATPAGDFAEVYAQWARGASSNRSELAGDVAPAQLRALAQRFFGA